MALDAAKLLLAGVRRSSAAAAARPFPDETGFLTLGIPLIEDGKPEPRDPSVTGYLLKPAGAGRLPAVVMMHGCDGLGWLRPTRPSWTLFKG